MKKGQASVVVTVGVNTSLLRISGPPLIQVCSRTVSYAIIGVWYRDEYMEE